MLFKIAPWMHSASSESPWVIFQIFLERNRSGQTIRQSPDGFANLLTDFWHRLPPPHLRAARGHCSDRL